MPSMKENNRGRVRKLSLPYLYLMPAVFILLSLLISPMITGILLSFQQTGMDGTVTWSGISNFTSLFTESHFITNIKNSLIYVLGNVLLSTPLAYLGALLITGKFKYVRYFRGIYLLLWISAPIVSTLLFRSMVDPNMGPIAKLIGWIVGEQVVILADSRLAMLVVVLHAFWRTFPFVMLFLSAGMASIPNEIYEAAIVDGAGAWGRFFYVTLPMTKSHLGISLLAVTMWTFQDAESIYAFTRGGPGYATETIAIRLFKSSFINFNLNLGAAIGVILVIFSMIFMSFYLRLMKEVD